MGPTIIDGNLALWVLSIGSMDLFQVIMISLHKDFSDQQRKENKKISKSNPLS